MLTRIFSEVGIREFTVHINDRRILKAMAAYAGFTPEQYDDVFIILDKMDKIGLEGVKESLLKKEYPAEAVEKYIALFGQIKPELVCSEFCNATCGEYLDQKVPDNMDTIISSVSCMINEGVHLMFDPTLVRGMSYYTGTIFEISIDGYNFSIAGGGRYDEMIGRFSNQPAPACGFSIGFERIVTSFKDLDWTEENGGKERTRRYCDGTAPEEKRKIPDRDTGEKWLYEY